MVALLATAALHIFVLTWFLITYHAPLTQNPAISTFGLPVVVLSMTKPVTPGGLSPPPMPTPRKKVQIDPVSMTPAQVRSTASSDAPAQSCSPLEAVTKAIGQDAVVISALANVPRSDRSISDVIVIWNAGWTDIAVSENAPLGPLRTMILRAIGAYPPECLAQLVAGPRLIPIFTTAGTSFLAIGSGSWSWSQLSEVPIQSPTIVLPKLTSVSPFRRFSSSS